MSPFNALEPTYRRRSSRYRSVAHPFFPDALHPRGHPVAHEQCQSAYPVAAPSRTDRFFSQGLVAFREHMTIEGWRAGSYRAFFFKRARVRFTVR
jgi:hypothetical protein